MALSIAVVALGYAPTMRPVGQQRSAVQMQEAAGQPDAISTTGGYVEAPTALKDELGAIGPLGYWDPLGMVRSPTCQSPCVLLRCVMNAAALHALSRCSLAACAAGDALLPPPASAGKARPDKFTRWRAVEIKHGRIAMMATTGARPSS
eukprot:scaffold61301_cov61-Phaeocystis_antarctica.AAC.4